MTNKTKKLLDLRSRELNQDKIFIDFPLLAPKSFIKRIKPNNPNDPLLLQILPQKKELLKVTGFSIDPLTETKHSPIPGVIHKYPNRVLLLTTNSCAINCRFCFRRHMQNKISDWQKVFNYIKNHPNINEVILSGGDPLVLNANELIKIIKLLAKIPHLKRLRIHSRVPVVTPERFIPKLTITRLPVVLVVHCNHPNEINAEVVQNLNRLHKTGVTIFNQSVLLRGINDNAKILIALSEKLFAAKVIPYYLHLLDKVTGAAHFCVNKNKAKKMHCELQKKLPGYLVPKLVVEVNNRKLYV
jgi:L-lysine 2,3-aminomutase